MNMLSSPLKVGPIRLAHRVVMAPLTRMRSNQPGDIPGDLMVKYYDQRASQGGLIISEATTVAITGRGYLGAPGIYTDAQVTGWKRVTEAVHAKGGKMFLQLDQFLQDGSNHRTDSYGGSVENRARFVLEVTNAVTSV